MSSRVSLKEYDFALEAETSSLADEFLVFSADSLAQRGEKAGKEEEGSTG